MWFRMAAVLCGVVAVVTPLQNCGPKLTLNEDDVWVFLVAGSNEYVNYRHQADIAHGYHVFLNQGVPADRIVTMMFDDIAFHKENPHPGVLMNKPNGSNVYDGVKIDYRGSDVNSANFLKVLAGNKAAMKGVGTGRVIESGPNSTLFVYFADHGGPGVLFFPNFESLLADELNNALVELHENNRYDKMIMYVDACYVGSVFEGIIREDTNIWVLAGSARDEGSWVWNCETSNYTTCKGDEFSVTLLDYLDSVEPGSYKTLDEVFQRVRQGVVRSHISVYGDLSVGHYSFRPNLLGKKPTKEGSRNLIPAQEAIGPSIRSEDVGEFYLKQTAALSNNLETRLRAKKLLENLQEDKQLLDHLMTYLVTFVTADNPKDREIINNNRLAFRADVFPCYKTLLHTFLQYCSIPEDLSFTNQLYKLANICILKLDTSNLLRAMPQICELYVKKGRTPLMA